MKAPYAGKKKNSKLTETDVDVIRKLLKQGMEVRDIAVIFGVSACAIYDIRKFATWKPSS